MSDIIASARNMTVVAEGQYNTVGLPKGGLTPATITAMVGFARGEGLQVSPDVTAAVAKLRAAYITNPSIGASANAAADSLETLSSKLLPAGNPTAFMSKLNQARAHIADSIELKKVTEFCKNQDLSKFGSGMNNLTSLASNGLDGVMGDFASAGEAFAAAGPLFDMSDMKNFGSPVGLAKKLASTKMANATGLNQKLTEAGVDVNDLENPAFSDKISKVMSGINDPKVLSSVAEQFGVNPPVGLPSVSNNSLTEGLLAAQQANPFAGVKSYTGADASINKSGDQLLGFGGSSGVNVEPSNNPQVWGGLNSAGAFGTARSPKVTVGTSTPSTAFGANQIEGQQGTGLAGLSGTPFEGLKTFATSQSKGGM